MVAYVLINEFDGGGALLLCADTDYATVEKAKEQHKEFSGNLRIAEIEITEKRRLII